MINYNKELAAQLNTILPTHYELFVDDETAIPCLTYQKINDYANEEGNSIRYSTITYRIKLWTDKLSDIDTYGSSLDELMFNLGFKRTSYNELWFGKSKVSAIFTYNGRSIEIN